MIIIIRTDSSNTEFQILVKELDAELKIRDGDEHAFFAQFNKTDKIQHVLVAYEGGIAVGCGAIKVYAHAVMEVKRIYVPPQFRSRGIASSVLKELENWCKELNIEKCILETGKNQPEAIQLYRKNNYSQIPNYGQYAESESSVCFEKVF